jgi:hypothetical protein
MDDRFSIDRDLEFLRRLYEEPESPGDAERANEEDIVLPHDDLLSIKLALDRRPRQRPEPHVIEAVMTAAAEPAPRQPAARKDRASMARRTGSRLRLVSWSALASVLIVGFGLLLSRPAPLSVTDRRSWAADSEERMAESESATESERLPVLTGTPGTESRTPPAPSPAPLVSDPAAHQAALARRASPAPPVLADESASPLAWDALDAVRHVHERVELLRARSQAQLWDEPAITRSMLQSTGLGEERNGVGIQPAGSRLLPPDAW